MRLRFKAVWGYLVGMRIVLSLFVLCFALPSLFAEAIKLQDSTGYSKTVSIAVSSTDARLDTLAKRAFDLHGAFKRRPASEATIQLKLEPAGASAVKATIQAKGSAPQQRTVRGRDLQNAALLACDMVVEWSVQSKGFFAGKLAFVGKRGGVSEVYSSNLLFGNVRALTSNRALVTGPSWSPKGDKLLYTSYHRAGFPDIFMMDFTQGRSVPVATYKGTNTGGRFSPDGSRIAMTLSGTGNAEIWVSDGSGKNGRRLTKNKSLEASPSWSPDGRRLVFTSDAFGKPQLYEMPANGGPMRRLPTNVSRYCAEPAWNPVKANQIAFTAAVGGGFQIFVYDAQQGGSTQITSVAGDAIEPCWLNDGRHLIFTQRSGGKLSLKLVDTESKRVSSLHSSNVGDASSASYVY